MKLELKENMYVRTKDGKIGKLMGYMAFDENKIAIWTNTTKKGIKITPVIDKDAIIKANYNIIDILEVGDYVNGYKVTRIEGTYHGRKDKAIYCDYQQNEKTKKWIMIYDDEIKSIVTKEQFEQMAYKVGE